MLARAQEDAQQVEPGQAFDAPGAVLIHVGTSQEFAQGHPPGARWAPRAWLERDIRDLAPDESTPIAAICEDSSQSVLAAQTLSAMGRQQVNVVAGGMAAYRAAGLTIEEGLTGVLSPPNDILAFGPQRGYADMQHYLRWETALGEKYESEAT